MIALLLISIQFSANFFTNNNPFFLFGWLLMLYTFMYHTRVVFHIFPDFPRRKNLHTEIDLSFYASSLDAYYGIVRPTPGVKPGTKKNTREYHTTTKKLLPGEDLLSGNGSKPQNDSFIRRAAQYRVLEDYHNTKLFQVQALRNPQLGTLGGKEWVYTDSAPANYVDSIVNKKNLGQNTVINYKPVSKVAVMPRSHFSLMGGFLAGCAFTCGAAYFDVAFSPSFSAIGQKFLSSGQDLPASGEVVKDKIDLYLESLDQYRE
jgi:hypothetical protein